MGRAWADDASMEPQRKGCGNQIVASGQGDDLLASMEPQRKGCGNCRWMDWAARMGHGFNGAAAKRLRKCQLGQFAQAAPRASMEPQRKGCGNLTDEGTFRCNFAKLQWSRSEKAAEICLPCRRRPASRYCFNGAAAKRLRKCHLGPDVRLPEEVASMGPQRKGCGNPSGGPRAGASTGRCFNGAAAKRLRKYGPGHLVAPALHIASMGPQRKGCGNSSPPSGSPMPRGWLQWGRSEKAAEIRFGCTFGHTGQLLQWGRSEKAAEIY